MPDKLEVGEEKPMTGIVTDNFQHLKGKDCWRKELRDSMQWEAVEHRPEKRPLLLPARYFVPRQVVRHGFEGVDSMEAQQGVPEDRLGWVKFSSVLAAIKAFDEYFEETRDGDYETSLYHHATKEEMPDGKMLEDVPDRHTQVRFDQHCILDSLRATLTQVERLFFMLEVPDFSSWASVGATMIIVTAILLSVLIFVMGSHPSFQSIPDECKAQQANPAPCKEMTDCVAVCEPQAIGILQNLELFCVVIFATEVTLRIVLAHKVRIQLRDWAWLQWFITGVSLEAELQAGSVPSIFKGSEMSEQKLEDSEFREKAEADKQMGALRRTYTYFMKPTTLLDVFSVAPYFVELMISPTGIVHTFPELIILRSLRMMRILRIFKLGKHGRTSQMLFRVLQSSMSSMFVLTLLVIVVLFISGTLIWLCEKGQWMPADHPFLVSLGIEGRDAFVRNTALLDDFPTWEESPFRSIPHSWWWGIITITTVGYGDVYPTSRSGKALASVTAIVGVVILAMPIGVIGNNFAKELNNLVDEKKKRDRAEERQRKKRLMRTFQKDAKKSLRSSMNKIKRGMSGVIPAMSQESTEKAASSSGAAIQSIKKIAAEPPKEENQTQSSAQAQTESVVSSAGAFGGARPSGAVGKLLAVIEPTVGDCAPALWAEPQQQEWLSAVREFAGAREEGAREKVSAEAVSQVGRGLGRWVSGSLLRLRPEALSGPELLRAVDRQVALLEAAAAAARELGSSVGVKGPPGWAQASAAIASTALLARCPSADTLSVSMASEGSTLSGDGWSVSGGDDQDAVQQRSNERSSSPEFYDEDELTPVHLQGREDYGDQLERENPQDYADHNRTWAGPGPVAHYSAPMEYPYHPHSYDMPTLEAAAAAARELGPSVGVAGPPGWAQSAVIASPTMLVRAPSVDTLSVSMACEGSTRGDGWSVSGGDERADVNATLQRSNERSSSPEFYDYDEDETTPVHGQGGEDFGDQLAGENPQDYDDPAWHNQPWDGHGPVAQYRAPMEYPYHQHSYCMSPESGIYAGLPYESAPGDEEDDVYEQPARYAREEFAREEYATPEDYFSDPPMPHYGMPYEGQDIPVGGYYHPGHAPPQEYSRHVQPDGAWMRNRPPPPGVLQEHDSANEYYR